MFLYGQVLFAPSTVLFRIMTSEFMNINGKNSGSRTKHRCRAKLFSELLDANIPAIPDNR